MAAWFADSFLNWGELFKEDSPESNNEDFEIICLKLLGFLEINSCAPGA